jgi:hypothetical protein
MFSMNVTYLQNENKHIKENKFCLAKFIRNCSREGSISMTHTVG